MRRRRPSSFTSDALGAEVDAETLGVDDAVRENLEPDLRVAQELSDQLAHRLRLDGERSPNTVDVRHRDAHHEPVVQLDATVVADDPEDVSELLGREAKSRVD